MHLHGQHDCDFSHTHGGLNCAPQLGVIDPVSAIFTASALKNVLGIGKKKRARKDMEAQAKEVYTSQFPMGVNWDRLLDMPNTNVIRGKQTTSRAAYNWMRGRNDSILVKNNIATPEDYMAYVVQKWINSDIGCNPSAKKGTQGYKLCPTFRENGINIFDQAAVNKYYAAKKKPPPVPKPRAVPKPVAAQVAPQIIPPSQVATGLMPQAGSGLDINKILSIIAGRSAQPQSVTVTAPVIKKSAMEKYFLPIALPVVAGITLFTLTRPKKRKRR